jgi:hypothetical protein
MTPLLMVAIVVFLLPANGIRAGARPRGNSRSAGSMVLA